tara:strand:- start:4219 stop:4971 length:753 start_codon:yes stop_codon:yes gene_type:complete
MIEYKKIFKENELRGLIHLGAKISWGFSESEATLPYHTLITILQSGGVIFGAFLEGEIIGYSISTIALKEEFSLYLYMLGVSDNHTSKGIGQQLFLKNKEYAIKKQMNSIYWSFNPFDPSAANLYLHKLNAVIKKPIFYNMYGIEDNGLPTDRFLAVLEISPNIKKRTVNNSFPKNFQIDSSLINRLDQFNLNNHNNIAIEFPFSLNNIDMKEFTLKFRVLFDKYLKIFIIVDFVRLKNEKKCYYLLKKI